MAQSIQLDGWVPDHQRLLDVGIYGEINRDSLRLIDSLAFYPMNHNESLILSWKGYEGANIYYEGEQGSRWDTTGIQVFRRAESIWAYFYRRKEESSWIPDGVIEQW